MTEEENIIPEEVTEETCVVENGNEPEERPLSDGYVVNPDGSVGHPGEEWDSK